MFSHDTSFSTQYSFKDKLLQNKIYVLWLAFLTSIFCFEGLHDAHFILERLSIWKLVARALKASTTRCPSLLLFFLCWGTHKGWPIPVCALVWDQIQYLLKNQNWEGNSYSYFGNAYIDTRKSGKCPSATVTVSTLCSLLPYNVLSKETGSFVPQISYGLGFSNVILWCCWTCPFEPSSQLNYHRNTTLHIPIMSTLSYNLCGKGQLNLWSFLII